MLDRNPINDDIEHGQELTAATLPCEAGQRRHRVARAEPTIQPIMVGSQEQVARPTCRERRRDRDSVELHLGGPIEL